jgi:hypothetical protein
MDNHQLERGMCAATNFFFFGLFLGFFGGFFFWTKKTTASDGQG